MVTVQLGNVSFVLTLILLILKGLVWTTMPWIVVLAPFWIPFAGWGLVFGAVLAWMIFLLIARIVLSLLSAIFK